MLDLETGRDDPVRRPGRPRAEDIDDRLIAATVELLIESEDGAPLTVAAIVARSGVSRAALYRRWMSREELIAAALDSVRSDVQMLDTGDLLADIITAYTIDLTSTPRGFDQLLRKRLVLALEDRELQLTYWRAHVSRRRVPVAAALRRGIDSGLLRTDLDIDAALDLIAGVYYYQMVVRGERTTDPETQRRVHDAIRMLWRGMLADREDGASPLGHSGLP